jgi:Patatin-like phospholipase
MRNTASEAFKRLHVPAQNRALLTLDGGGIRGILTLQLLKALEEQAGAPCYRIFDLVAGTSTGGIIAGLIASGKTAVEIEALYEKLVSKVFLRRDFFANQFVNPPAWSKASYRRLLKELLGDVSLQAACDATGIDLLLTAHDVAEGEETFFSYLHERPPEKNRYGGVLLRGVMEATMSAPTYFTPFERFVDGGTTTYNNPTLAAVLEAVQYGSGTYSAGKLSVFSFGTGCRTQLIAPEQVPHPPGPDTPFWLGWLMTESGNDASDMQSDLFRATALFNGCDYRRFQISLDPLAIKKLPDLGLEAVHATDAQALHELTDKELSSIQLDNVAYFPVMKVLGEGMVAYLRAHAAGTGLPMFGYDLIHPETGHELLITRSGDVDRIARQMSDPAWIDGQPD